MSTDIDMTLTASPRAAQQARRALDGLEGEFAPKVLDDLKLLVSELVTNSVRHAGLTQGEPVRLRVQSLPHGVRVDVCDTGPGFETRDDPPSLYQSSGWGLYFVDRLADRWGVDRGTTSCVWFELDC